MSSPHPAEAAREALRWVDSVGVEVGCGRVWAERGELCDDLYAGTAGVLLGCAEATAAGLDAARVADGARTRLVHLARHEDAEPTTLPDDGLFSGWGGVAAALQAWSGVTGDGEAADAAGRVRARIAARSTQIARTRCTDVISGDAGILLALLADPRHDDAAHAVADRLVAAAEPTDAGLRWRMTVDSPHIMPGFSHGTAGVAYALAAAGRELGRADLVEIAERGAEELLALGDHADGWAVPLVIPPQEHRPPVFFGWCHGPTGTVRLFTLMWELDPQSRWRHAIEACLQALRDSNLPERLYPGYWDNLGRCCGTAGVGQLLLERHLATGDDRLLSWARELADDVLARSTTQPRGLAWSNTEHTSDPPDLPAEPGFMQGAAGIAGWLGRLAAVQEGRAVPTTVVRLAPPWI
jgi:lantibiotic modifying enzyme